MALNIDLDHDNAEEMEKQMAAGGIIPAGRYTAFLQDAIDETSVGDKNVSKLTFEIADGPYAGRKIKATVFHEGKDAESTKTCQLHLRRYMKRLAVMEEFDKGDGTKGHRFCDGMAGFEDAIGNECVIEVIQRAEDKFNSQTGQYEMTGRTFNDIKMHGIYTLAEAAEIAKKEAEKAAGGGKGRGRTTPPATNGHQPGEVRGNPRAASDRPVSAVNTDGL